jgi:hypothetical protein
MKVPLYITLFSFFFEDTFYSRHMTLYNILKIRTVVEHVPRFESSEKKCI